jgi:hypothetical protein
VASGGTSRAPEDSDVSRSLAPSLTFLVKTTRSGSAHIYTHIDAHTHTDSPSIPLSRSQLPASLTPSLPPSLPALPFSLTHSLTHSLSYHPQRDIQVCLPGHRLPPGPAAAALAALLQAAVAAAARGDGERWEDGEDVEGGAGGGEARVVCEARPWTMARGQCQLSRRLCPCLCPLTCCLALAFS